MSLLKCTILTLLLLADDLLFSLANHQSASVTAILQSYANIFTNRPEEKLYSTTLSYLNDDNVKQSASTYEFTTIKPGKQYHNKIPLDSHDALKTAGTNTIEKNYDEDNFSSEENDENEDPEGPPDHVIPYSEHENPKEPPTRPNYTAPGEWAKPPAEKNIPLNFIPSKLYAQVRATHVTRRLPREEAIRNAETDEEKENAARLREVVKISKANTIYTEEGYEDAAYDHAGQIRDADFHEGFARKLKEDFEKQKVRGDGNRPKSVKKYKPQKTIKMKKLRNLESSDEDYRNNLNEVAEEARTLKQQVKSENLKTLKNALNMPIINPKTVVQNGIVELEENLRNESYEVEKTSTEPYSVTTITHNPPTTQSVSQNNVEYDTTTVKNEIFTIKPRKLKKMKSIKPKSNLATIKRPINYYGVSKNNYDSNNNSNASYSDESTTVNYRNPFRQYLRNKQSDTSITVSPLIANPLAVATVNGHGPYLVMVNNEPNTFKTTSLENQDLETTISHFSNSNENVTQPIIINSHNGYNPYIAIDQNLAIAKEQDLPQHIHSAINNNSKVYKGENNINKNKSPTPYLKFDTTSNYAKMLEYLNNQKNKQADYYTVIQPPVIQRALITYPDYSRRPYGNVFEQWAVSQSSERPVESVYNLLSDIERPRNEPVIQKSALPVTRLLPPSPLSNSEYASFHMQASKSEPIPPSVVAIMPIIRAIHKREKQYNTFPFFFRRKRSIINPSQESEIKQKNRKLREIKLEKNSKDHSKTKEKSSNNIYPQHFENLLNESPRIASEIVDKEIKERFKDTSQESHEASRENSQIASTEKQENSKGKHTVEVEVPELDFSNIFEEEEISPTTKESGIDIKKYPFYHNDEVAGNTALKYIINPIGVPRKTLGGMEFYNSRNLECEELEPDLEKIVPEEEELANKRGARKSKPRLHGLGDKLDCYKAKFFDKNPLDNPLFLEKEIKIPPPPVELDPKKFASRILKLSSEKDEYVVPRGPKRPEQSKLKMRSRRYNRTRDKLKLKNSDLKVLPAYQRQVYEDVMETIKNLEKMKKTPIRQRGLNNNNREHEKSHYDVINKQRPDKISGLVPPPLYIYLPIKVRNFAHTNHENNYDFDNERIQNIRVYKRSINLNKTKDTKNEAKPSINQDTEKNSFQIIVTTPASKKFKRKNGTIITNESTPQINFTTNETIPKISFTINNHTKYPNRSTESLGRYDKFFNKENLTLPIVTRRKEPRYNILNKRFNYVNDSNNNTMSTLIKSETPKTIVQSSTVPSDSGSTLIPVIVKPDKNFTIRIPQESKTTYTKKKLQETYDEDNKQEELNNKDTPVTEDNNENIKKNINDEKSNEYINQYTASPNIEEHKEFYKFLKGDPPGYAKAFGSDKSIDLQENKFKKSLKINELHKNNPYRKESDESSEEETSKEKYIGEGTSENTKEEPTENFHAVKDKEESFDEANDEVFTRYSSRPYSPSENYEDEKYSDLGPRVNKPYFYHPPFEVPEYQKYALEKTIGISDNAKSAEIEETNDHERYIFPWENDEDEDEEKAKESKQHSVLGRYEYPWERRERKEKERKKKERLQKKFNKKYGFIHEDEDESNEDSRQATNARLVYIPIKKNHSRGKKDIKNAEENSKTHPNSKFSSKYKSDTVKFPLNEEEMFVNAANNDEIKQSILSYLENIEVSKPKVKSSQTLHKSILNDRYTKSSIIDLPENLNNTNKFNVRIKTTSTKPSPVNNNTKTTSPINSTSKSSVHVPSHNLRSRLSTNNKINSTTTDQITNSTISNSSIPAPLLVRRRGHNKNSFNSTTTTSTTTSPRQTSSRRRNRPISNGITSTTIPSTTKTTFERRRKSSRNQSSQEENKNLKNVVRTRSTTLSSVPTSTVRTIEHHSRISKEEIITKTIYPDEEEDEGDVQDKSSKRNNKKTPSEKRLINYTKIQRRKKPANDLRDEHTKKKEKIEKVTITMEETPNHVYKTKEIDKDGVKGKFISITPNNNSAKTKNENNAKDAEIEEMKKRMNAVNSFDSVIQDGADLSEESSDDQSTKNYLVVNSLRKLPLPASRRAKLDSDDEDDNSSDQSTNEDDNDDDGDDDNDNEGDNDSDNEDDNDDSEESNDSDNDNFSDRKRVNDEEEKINDNNDTVTIVKDPNKRRYFYVE